MSGATTIALVAVAVVGIYFLLGRDEGEAGAGGGEGAGPCNCTPTLFQHPGGDGRPAGKYLRRGDCSTQKLPPISLTWDPALRREQAKCSSIAPAEVANAQRAAGLLAAHPERRTVAGESSAAVVARSSR